MLNKELNALNVAALIESRKKSLMQEKEELQRNLRENNFFPKSNLNEASLPRSSNFYKNHTTTFDVDRNGQVKNMEKNGSFLNFADSEIQRKKLNDERKSEYMQYLAERQKQISAYKSSLDDAYKNMVQQKQREEAEYRVQFGEAVKERGQRKKIIEFDSDEEELFQQVLQAKKRIKSADETQRVIKLNEQKRSATFDNGFSSYPLSSIFEADSNRNDSMKAEKSKQYKKELEEQIKEKETLKMRDKLKRLGRINSDSDLNEMSNTIKAGYSVPAHPQSAVNANDANKMFWNTNQNFSPTLHQNATMPWTNYAMSAPPIGYMPSPPVSFIPAPPMGYSANNPFVYLPTQYSAPPVSTTLPAASVQVPQTQLVASGSSDQYITLNSSRINEADKKTIENIPRRAVNQPPGGKSHGFMGSSLCTEDVDTNRAKKLAYSEELNRQMELKKLAAKKEKDERDRFERKIDAEVAIYDPWGKGGGGAPVRNKQGEIIADLRKLRQPMTEPLDLKHEEISPILKALSENDGTREIQQNLTDVKNTDKNHSKSLSQENFSPNTYARGAALRELKGQSNMSPREKSVQDDYKMFLKQQVEEKKKRDQELKEKTRLEEEKENQRLLEQQRKMKEDFDKEKERQRQKEEDLRRQNEELRLLAEQKRKKEDSKQKEIGKDYDLFSKNEAEQANKQQNVTARNVSPPVPAAIKDKKNNTMTKNNDTTNYRKETTKEQADASFDVIKKSFEIQNQSSHISVSQQEALIKQLAALRKQLQAQENKVKEDLEKNKEKHAAIVQSSSKKRAKPLTKGILETMSKDANEVSSNDRNNSILLSKQQQEYMREQEMRLKLLREGLEKNINNHKKPFSDEPSNQSLLESDSKFINVNKHEKGKKFGKNQENVPQRFEKDFKEHFKAFFENDRFSKNPFDDLQQSNLENLQRFSFSDDNQPKSKDNEIQG